MSKNGTQSATHSSFSNDTSDAPNTSPVLYQVAQQREQHPALLRGKAQLQTQGQSTFICFLALIALLIRAFFP